MEILYKFDIEELRPKYMLVKETFTLGSQRTKTGRGKRLFAEMFSLEEMDDAMKMIDECKGINTYKNSRQLTTNDVMILNKLCEYCWRL